MILLVSGLEGDRWSTGSCADIMNCSLSTSYLVNTKRQGQSESTNQHTDHRIMIRIIDVVGQILHELKQALDKIVVHENCPVRPL